MPGLIVMCAETENSRISVVKSLPTAVLCSKSTILHGDMPQPSTYTVYSEEEHNTRSSTRNNNKKGKRRAFFFPYLHSSFFYFSFF